MSGNWVRQPSKHSVEAPTLKALSLEDDQNTRIYKIVARGVSRDITNVILKATGINTSDYDHTVDNYFVKHAYTQHKHDKVPLRKCDYKKIPSIIKSAGRVYWDGGTQNVGKNRGDKKKQRNGVVVYEKKYRRGKLVYLEEIRKKRRELAAKTMYWQD